MGLGSESHSLQLKITTRHGGYDGRKVDIMKSIELKNHGTLYVGSAHEIIRLYRGLKKRNIAYPNFCTDPKVNFLKYYGLMIHKFDLDGNELLEWTMNVVAGDTALAMIYDL